MYIYILSIYVYKYISIGKQFISWHTTIQLEDSHLLDYMQWNTASGTRFIA